MVSFGSVCCGCDKGKCIFWHTMLNPRIHISWEGCVPMAQEAQQTVLHMMTLLTVLKASVNVICVISGRVTIKPTAKMTAVHNLETSLFPHENKYCLWNGHPCAVLVLMREQGSCNLCTLVHCSSFLLWPRRSLGLSWPQDIPINSHALIPLRYWVLWVEEWKLCYLWVSAKCSRFSLSLSLSLSQHACCHEDFQNW